MTDRTLNFRNLPWARFLAEAALIVGSVYFAIVLESASQDREARSSAHLALVQMLAELREDSADLNEIREEQLERSKQYVVLDRWLSSPESIPLDSVSETLDLVFFSNRTLYPRRSAWTTMLSAGQLAELESPGLVSRLGDFYESLYARVVDNGDDYDQSLNDLARNSVPKYWDGTSGRLLTTDDYSISIFRNQLRYLHVSWNIWYLDLLDNYGQALDSLILEIESYLEKQGIKTDF